LLERHLFDEMARDPDPVEETSGGRLTAPAPPVEPNKVNGIPRDALLLVLSRLEAHEVVRTCVLSREWCHLWCDVPRINVLRHKWGADADGSYEEGNPPFKKFVNRLLMLRNPVPLDRFGLWHYIGSQLEADSADAKLWIAHALLSKARKVEVFAWGNALEIGPGVFTSHIDDTEISSRTLEILAVIGGSVFTSDGRLSISIPSLLYLQLFGQARGRIPLLENTESLKIAYVSFGWFEGIGIQPHDDFRQFLRSISGAVNLEFYFVQTELNMEKSLQWCPKFNNLLLLTLGEWCLLADFYALIVILQNSPNLYTLTLNRKRVHMLLPNLCTFTFSLYEKFMHVL
ncbi:hypothetical protein BAE44_0008786, partial [Dichanthelium oligosanthes]